MHIFKICFQHNTWNGKDILSGEKRVKKGFFNKNNNKNNNNKQTKTNKQTNKKQKQQQQKKKQKKQQKKHNNKKQNKQTHNLFDNFILWHKYTALISMVKCIIR